jgi:hypothetical protein
MSNAIIETEISHKVFEQPGYSTDLRLTPQELRLFQDCIETQWLARIRDVYPALADRFAEVGLANYHQLAHLVDHVELWPKEYRLFPREWVQRIKACPIMDRLRDAFGEFSISNVVYGDTVEQGREEIYWRLVRPHAQSDAGPLHTDKWFHELLGPDSGLFPPGATTLKIWLAVVCEPGLNGLIVVPNSHLREWRYTGVNKGGYLKPEMDEPVDPASCILVPADPGTLVIFNERLLHRGAVNLGTFSRVSVEITMVFD